MFAPLESYSHVLLGSVKQRVDIAVRSWRAGWFIIWANRVSKKELSTINTDLIATLPIATINTMLDIGDP